MEKNTSLTTSSNLSQVIEQDKIDALLKGEERVRKQNFLKLINQDPLDVQSIFSKIRKHPIHKNAYIPISVIEMMLDQLFFGEWSTRNYTSKQVLNEVVGDIELVVVHPVTGREIVRTGSAAVPIQQDKGAKPQQIEKKKVRALEKDYPHVKAEAVKNAAKSLGRIFGRDLGRKDDDSAGDYSPLMNEEQEQRIHKSLAEKIDEARGNGNDE